MSLRELPTTPPGVGDRWRRLRYVPLIILLILAVVASVIGFIVARKDASVAAAKALPAPVEFSSAGTKAVERALPESCSPPVERPKPQPWLTGNASATESTWLSHSAEMTQAYITGQQGWVDWGDIQAQNFSQVVGRRVLTTGEAARWHDYFAKIRDDLAAKGVPLYIAITPAKFDVYPQYLPEWAQELRGSGPLDQLIDGYPDLPIIDLRQPLRQASVTQPVYSRVNSHWTDYGAYVGWKNIAECIGRTSPSIGNIGVPAIHGVSLLGGFNEFETYGVVNPSPDWTVPDYAEPLKPVFISRADGSTAQVPGSMRTGLEVLPARTQTADAQSTKSALVLRDSFGSSMSVELQQSFATTWQVRHNFDSGPGQQPDVMGLVKKDKPDIVIFQIAERHLNFPPTP